MELGNLELFGLFREMVFGLFREMADQGIMELGSQSGYSRASLTT